MRSTFLSGFCCLPLWILTAFPVLAEAPPPACPNTSQPYRFRVEGSINGGSNWNTGSVWVYGYPGSQVQLSVRTLMTILQGQTNGWTFGLRHVLPSNFLSYGGSASFTRASIYGTNTATVQNGGQPDTSELGLYTCGYTQGVVVDTNLVTTLSPTSDFVTSKACYRITMPYYTGYYDLKLTFTHDLGSPAIRSMISQNGQSFVPCQTEFHFYLYVSYSVYPTSSYCSVSGGPTSPQPCEPSGQGAGAGGVSQMSGMVFTDANSNGLKDTGETGLAGATVCLKSQSLSLHQEVLTPNSGSYTFSNLAAANDYVVTSFPPSRQLVMTFPPPDNRLGTLQGRWDGSTTGYADVWGVSLPAGDFALVGHSGANPMVEIIDVSKPCNPTLKWTWTPDPGGAGGCVAMKDVTARGSVGVFASDGAIPGGPQGCGIVLVDLSVLPARPPELSRINQSTVPPVGGVQRAHNLVHNAWVDGNLLFTADDSTPRVHIHNIANPQAPFFTGTAVAPSGGTVHDGYARGSLLFLCVLEAPNVGGGVDILNISNPSNPQNTGRRINGLPSAHSCWLTPDGRTLVVAQERPLSDPTGQYNVTLWDVSGSTNPTYVASIVSPPIPQVGNPIAWSPHNPIVAGNDLYVSWYQAGSFVFDITNPGLPCSIPASAFYSGPFLENVCGDGTYPIGHFNTFALSNREASHAYEGNWGIYPLLGPDRILASDIDNGLLVLSSAGSSYEVVISGPGESSTGLDFGFGAQAPPRFDVDSMIRVGTQHLLETCVKNASGICFRWTFTGAGCGAGDAQNFLWNLGATALCAEAIAMAPPFTDPPLEASRQQAIRAATQYLVDNSTRCRELGSTCDTGVCDSQTTDCASGACSSVCSPYAWASLPLQYFLRLRKLGRVPSGLEAAVRAKTVEIVQNLQNCFLATHQGIAGYYPPTEHAPWKTALALLALQEALSDPDAGPSIDTVKIGKGLDALTRSRVAGEIGDPPSPTSGTLGDPGAYPYIDRRSTGVDDYWRNRATITGSAARTPSCEAALAAWGHPSNLNLQQRQERVRRAVHAFLDGVQPFFIYADANTDDKVDLSDAVYLLNWLFMGTVPDPRCLDAADANHSAAINISDAIFVLDFLFRGGPEPFAPFAPLLGCETAESMSIYRDFYLAQVGNHVEERFGIAAQYWMYAHYAVALAIEQLPDGDEKDSLRVRLAGILQSIREPDGAWRDNRYPFADTKVGTAMALLSLMAQDR